VELEGITVEGSFKVFDSGGGGGWDFLFGKRLMTAFATVHDYTIDEVSIPDRQLTLRNQHSLTTQQQCDIQHKLREKHIENKCENEEGDKAQSPVREVPSDHVTGDLWVVDIYAPVTTPADCEGQREPSMNGRPTEEKQDMLMGDRAMSP